MHTKPSPGDFVHSLALDCPEVVHADIVNKWKENEKIPKAKSVAKCLWHTAKAEYTLRL